MTPAELTEFLDDCNIHTCDGNEAVRLYGADMVAFMAIKKEILSIISKRDSLFKSAQGLKHALTIKWKTPNYSDKIVFIRLELDRLESLHKLTAIESAMEAVGIPVEAD